MSFQVVRVSTKREVKEFVNMVFDLYKDDPNWVAPLIFDQMNFLNPEKNPYYRHSAVQLFLVRDGQKCVGRISAHTNRQHNAYHHDRVGFFGFFECIDHQEVAHILFKEASEWLVEQGCDSIRGPFNFSTNEECGLLIDGYDSSPFIMMTHHLDYYPRLIEKEGLSKAKDLYAWLLRYDKMPDFLDRIGKSIIAKEPSFTVRPLNKKKLKEEIETVFTIYQKAWEVNWGFVPMIRDEFDHLVKSLLPVVVPDLVYIAECEGKPIGFSVTLPNYNIILQKLKGHLFPFGIFKLLYYKNKIKSLRVLAMGVVGEYQTRGIDSLFYYYSWKKGLELGYNCGEFSWVLEDNTSMNRIAKHLGAHIHKTYRIYEKSIG